MKTVRTYRVVETATSTTTYVVMAESVADAERDYLLEGEEVGSRVRERTVESVTEIVELAVTQE